MNEDMVRNAVARVEEAYKFSRSLGLGKLYVCFSGGKDSVAIYGVCKLAFGDKLLECCDFEYNVTNVDPPRLVQFIKKEYPFVHFNLPRKTIWDLIIDNRNPPTRLMRYCCKELKEKGGEGRFCVTGVRWAESVRRRNERHEWEGFGATKSEKVVFHLDNEDDRRTLEHCIPKRKYICNPIIDWSDDEVWDFIKENGIKYCSLYDEGWERLGCIACPMAKARERRRALEENPKIRAQYVRTFERMLEVRRERELPIREDWKDGEAVLQWWLSK